jgi:excinuclease ABC subunit A
VYAEGQIRYVESLSAYARQFLERIEKPDVDLIDGLAPAIAIKQKNSTRNPRSTVATATEIYDYMRLLYARCGTVHCPLCGGVVRRDSVDELAASILELGEGTRLYALFPIEPKSAPLLENPPESTVKKPKKAAAKAAASRSGLAASLKDRLGELRKRGFNRLYQSGRIVEFSTPESLLELDFAQPIFVLVDPWWSRPRIVRALWMPRRSAIASRGKLSLK